MKKDALFEKRRASKSGRDIDLIATRQTWWVAIPEEEEYQI